MFSLLRTTDWLYMVKRIVYWGAVQGWGRFKFQVRDFMFNMVEIKEFFLEGWRKEIKAFLVD